MVIDLAGFITLLLLIVATGFCGVALMVLVYWASALRNWIACENSKHRSWYSNN